MVYQIDVAINLNKVSNLSEIKKKNNGKGI